MARTLYLDGFPKGLDARRFHLNAPPGTLVELVNGHLTNGAEIEKRKSFPIYANVAIAETGAQLTAGVRTFGIQKTASGLTVFGSAMEYFTAPTVTRATAANVATLNIGAHSLRAGDLVTITGIAGYTAANVALISAVSPLITYANVHANEGTTSDVTGTVVLTAPTLSRPVLASAMPAGITFQQLQHVAVGDGETYDKTQHAMTAIKSSTTFGGLIYAIATFADGSTFGYYDGTIDRSYTDGLIMAHLNTNTKIATALKEMVNRSADYTATNPSASVARVTGPVGLFFDTSAIDDSAGTLTAAKVSDPTGAYEARQAIGSFQISAGSHSAGVNKITKVEVGPAAGPLVTITNAAVDWTNSNEFTAALLAASINTKASTPEYTAEANGNTVTIKALQADGDSPNDYVVVTTAAGNVCVGKSQFQIQSVTAFNITALMINGESILAGGAIAVGNAATAATAVVTDINANTTSGTAHGYQACANGAVISISKAVTRSDDANLPIYFVTSATINSGNGVFEVGTGGGSISTLTALLTVVGAQNVYDNRGTYVIGKRYILSLTITGGIAPYQSPVWHGGVVTSNGAGLYMTNAVGLTAPPPHVYCIVTDSSLATTQSNTL